MDFLKEIKNFNKGGLSETETKVKTCDGKVFVERKSEDGYTKTESNNPSFCGWVVDNNPDMNVAKIRENLYLGSQDVTRCKETLIAHKISHILTLVPGVEPSFPNDFTYKIIPVLDLPEFVISTVFEETNKFIEDCLETDHGVFVHCNAGLSRAPTIVAAYLMKSEKLTAEEALNEIEKTRPLACPNAGFQIQLKLYEKNCGVP